MSRYDPIRVPAESLLYNRPRYSLEPDWVVYACPQSNFKLHPDWDAAAARILAAVPNSRLLMVEDRHDSWTHQVRVQIRRQYASCVPVPFFSINIGFCVQKLM